MYSSKFLVWCRTATEKIKFPPDREAVYRELYQHLEDSAERKLEAGLPEEEAVEQVLGCAGDPEELAPQLAAIHRPFWGYAWSVTKKVLAIALMFTFIRGVFFAVGNGTYADDPLEEYYTETALENNARRLSCFVPEVSVSSDGYTFTVTQAALWQFEDYDKNGKPDHILFFRVEEYNPLPWAEHADILQYFYARDNLGNHYKNRDDHSWYNEPALLGNAVQTGPFTQVHSMRLQEVDPAAEWIEVCYDRAGRDLVLRIELEKGEKA